jgi:hypothetical protein
MPNLTTERPNPVDDAKGYVRPLVKALQRHVDTIARSMPDAATTTQRTQIAGTWVYLSAIVAWAEDHQLVDPWLRKGLEGMPGRFTDRPGYVVKLAQTFAGLTVHPATQWLLHPRYSTLHDGTPSEDACRELAEWWATDAPSLAYDVDTGPTSISGWIIGDLLQHVTDERRKAHALAQTPWWVADFILDRTLLPAAAEFTDEPLRTIDPTAGTGHFLIRVIDYLWEWYTTGTLSARQAQRRAPVSGGTPRAPIDAIKRILADVDAVELDPLTAAVARLRCTVYIGHLMHAAGLLSGPLRLDRIPQWVLPRVAVGDSLLLGLIGRDEYNQLHPRLADLPGAAFPLSDFSWKQEIECRT